MWPESSPTHPKHFLPLIKSKSLFELNWEMLRKRFGPEKIFLQTNPEQAKMARELVEEIVEENIFIEPEMRNQGPATGFAAAMLLKRGFGDEPFMLIQADLIREDEETFFVAMEMMDGLARKNEGYMTGGMMPINVVSGVDYVIKGELIEEKAGVKVYKVEGYVDRSERERVEAMVGSKNLLLHWNHSCMTPNNLLKMYQEFRPDWYGPLMEIANGADVVTEYGKMPKGMIEEVTSQVHAQKRSIIVEFPFKIWDFGTWESLGEYEKEKAVARNGRVVEIEGGNNYVRSKKPVAIIGLSDLCVIESEDGVLVCPKKESGKVGEVVKALETKTLQR